MRSEFKIGVVLSITGLLVLASSAQHLFSSGAKPQNLKQNPTLVILSLDRLTTPIIIGGATPIPVQTEAMPSTTVSPQSVNTEESTTPHLLSQWSLAQEPASTPSPLTYFVQRGDSLARIAQRFQLPLSELIRSNNLSNPNRLQIGQAIVVPVPLIGPVRWEPSEVLSATDAEAAIPDRQDQLNGLSIGSFVIFDESAKVRVREIYAIGQGLGRNPRAFSKLGDSTIENPFFLARFDTGPYNLGPFSYLQPVIDYYAGSFGRSSAAVRRGLHTWSVLDPMWASGACSSGQHMLECEFSIHNPSILFVRLGSNDRGIPESTDRHLREIVDYAITNGVIPIMGTKADRFDGPDAPNNAIIRQIAVDYHLPLWDFDLVASTIPGRGLERDNVHMTSFYAHDWNLPSAYRTGHGVHNISALIVLESVWKTLNED